MVYVKVNPENKPYLSDISFEPKDGYIEKPDLPVEQMITLIYFTEKCKLDDNGNIQVSNDKILSDDDVKNQALQMQLKMMQMQFSNLILSMAKGDNK
ncbi:hypothetical protein AKUH3B102A_PHAGE100580 (plasmid) [Apilactobacillus kunkeei]|nr:hypothetical protein AKUH3B102A_PHAGE100580 [Apilactobacillus kunkeei]CAI2700316.1 hypothetical protein AKUH3B107A_PHAGE100580 [Apilactobacillus kunkeei]